MKSILIKLVLLFSIATFSFAQSVYENSDFNESDSAKNSADLSKLQSIFLSYEEVPKKVYVGEVFPVKVKAIIANEDFEEISSMLLYGENIEIINQDAKWQWFSDNIFYNTFYFKANDTTSKLPNIKLSIYQGTNRIESATLEATQTNIVKLNGTKYFSNIIAKSLNVKKYKATYFDDKNLIVVLEIEANESNLDNFKLKWVTRDGIDSSVNNLPFHKIFYYAIIPDYVKKFDFTYFNSGKNKFEKISLPITVTDDKISTQIDLNPAESSLQIYKDSAYVVIAIVLLLLFIKRRRKTYLVLLLALIALFLYNKNPLNSVKIDKNKQIRILPTSKSTVFFTTNRTLYAQKLDEKDEYIKILLPNGKIGWIKDDNYVKN